MFEDFGQKIRTIRQHKRIGLNQLARRLNVSPAYLSNLETGKTKKIEPSFLHSLEKELNILSTEYDNIDATEFNEFQYRVNRASSMLTNLEKQNPAMAHYLLQMVEQGVELFQNQTDQEKSDLKKYH
ncbi:helix-turn-helix domain-containing protein [Calidifontibacillus oryziterrae]|uniref:helix-turn-helix domain-containing protein n=1 Tax=Calidifontibacillus oryziterrae TaxID=1191699 RepID=UPI0002E123F9|nr:helix-turn-helix transcriptional regulator [Calidifontibacillus oryziterrae]